MIIRMTLDDNDFTEFIEKFADRLFLNLMHYVPENPDDIIEMNDAIAKLLVTQEKYSPDIIAFCVGIIEELWYKYVKECSELKTDTEYLINKFKVSMSTTYEEKWENGEAVYYFTSNQHYITQ